MKPSVITNVAKIQTQTPPKYRPEALSRKADQISYNKCKIRGSEHVSMKILVQDIKFSQFYY